jgi:hypothetical protein
VADTLFIVPFQMWIYGIVRTMAIRFWLANRAFLLAGLMIQAINDWLVRELFGPAISDFALLSRGLLPTFFTIAVFLLAFSYLLAPFFKVRVVSLGKAIGWLLFALLFYQAGPGLYVEGEGLRRRISSEFYAQVLDQASASSTTSGPISIIHTIESGPDDAMGALENQFGAFIPTDRYVDGLDLAMAYALATGSDVVYALTDLPEAFAEEYFDPATGPLFFLSMTADERTESINRGLTGMSRLAMAIVIIVFGLFEQAIYLCLSIAAGILFISMSIAILFAFFERTELIARTLIDMWFELFILSIIISVIQAFIVGLVTVGARTLNPTMTLGASFIGAIVMVVLLLKAIGAIWDSLNRMFQAMSQSVGGGLMSPAEAGSSAAGVAAGAALTIATAGAGAAVAAGAGASLSQIAGSALSGMDSLYGAAAMGSFVLPDESPLKATAQGFYEGALSNRVLGPLGGLLLRDGAPTQAAATPSAGADTPVPGDAHAAATAQGEMDIRFDSADLTGLRDAVATAMNQALLRAPVGGYATADEAIQAVRDALMTLPMAGTPTGMAGSDPRLGDYLDQRAAPIASYIMVASQSGAAAPLSPSAVLGGNDHPGTEDATSTSAAQPTGAYRPPTKL